MDWAISSPTICNDIQFTCGLRHFKLPTKQKLWRPGCCQTFPWAARPLSTADSGKWTRLSIDILVLRKRFSRLHKISDALSVHYSRKLLMIFHELSMYKSVEIQVVFLSAGTLTSGTVSSNSTHFLLQW